MVESAELIGLLHQIRGAARPLDRLRLATLAWRTLRALGPVERMAVAKALGVEGAERLVEQLGSVRGISPSMLMTAIRKAEDADPDELRRLFHQLRDPETREEAVAETLESVEEWLVDGSDHVRVVEPVVAGAKDSGSTPIPAKGVATPSPPATPAADVAATPATPSPPRVPAPPPATSSSARPASDAAVTAPRAATRAPRASASAPGSTGAPSPRPAPPTAPPRPTRRPARPTPAFATASQPNAPMATLLERLRGAANDLQRLRLLDRCPAEILRLSETELERVAELFPPGWRRRRALEAMARAGRPTSDLLALLAAFPHPGVTAWVLATLVERGDFDLEAAEVGSPSLLRRLRLRLQRQTRQ